MTDNEQRPVDLAKESRSVVAETAEERTGSIQNTLEGLQR